MYIDPRPQFLSEKPFFPTALVPGLPGGLPCPGWDWQEGPPKEAGSGTGNGM